MSRHTHNNPSNNGRSAFPTSSTDFGLPFGGSTPSAAPSSNTSAFNNAGAASHSFFQSTASSAPISIPSSPSFSLSCNPAASSHHVPLLSLSNGVASSPSKLSTSGTGLGIGNLPSPSTRERGNPLAQTQSSSAFNGQPHSPTLSLAGEAWPPPPFAGFASASSSFSSGSVATPAALLRRAQGMNSPGFAIGSPARFRRASMLGREITPFHLNNEDRSDEDEQSRSKGKTAAQQADSNRDPDDGDDEMMQVEDDEPATASRAPSTPIMGPPLSLFSTPSTPPPASSHLPHTRPSLPSSALARTSASDSGQDSSSSAGAGGLSRTVPRSPSAGPSIGSPLSHAGNRSRSSSLLNSSNVIRKAITRRPNLFPKDRSVARVAASLQDESKPEDSEIASEAKLQKRLGGEATLPRTPRFGPSGGGATASGFDSTSRTSRTPLFGASASGSSGGHARRKYMWDDDVDDIRGVFTADGLDDVDSSGISSEEEEKMMYYSRTDSLSDEEDGMRSRLGQNSNDMQNAPSSCATTGVNGDANIHGNNTAGGGSGSAALSTSFGAASASSPGPGSLPKRKNNSLWMGFRDKGHAHKWSPGGSGSASAAGAGSGVFSGERVAWRRVGGTSAGIGMDVDTSPRVLGAAGAGVRLSKRKTMGDDRYEPYKRRAVSPMNLGSSLGTTPTNASLAAAAAAAVANTPTFNAAHASSAAVGSNSPLMMPISSPSGGILYRGIHHHHHYHAAYASRYSTSPTISRPCTPVNSTSNAGVGAAFSPAGTGSGPGYGSGALGLSISANNPQSLESRVQMEQQQENEALMDQRVGMLGLS
ncbi:hypothetical protein NDA11_006929 [Ustilago hordei]|uniref:Uncharacterized protein n=1 Tax=Ustilago hordei TaxID=120017 RepID=I2FUM8_USTHO|nr:uncharacterized protein UHO2_05059 [Ustilago hordei]KAJ1043348.1 hypothetical protein NDA10_006667 [Ustilago hordei]KAJ1577632.1 hypothetical protein NDA11_006929 [Ustilago hordei]KAJ1597692.1 hypothetical protein NDA14_001206 [Ustilago hordei]UTT89213.1 hypothetical protein NDA17_000203 [Ustilago hordei]CCF50621.1 uncharacterized protein UHOR_05864 [Ustilago hordei]